MLFPFFAATRLALECQTVIGLRVAKLISGGWDAHDEAHLMVGEKVNAAIEAASMAMAGRSTAEIIARLHEQVAANSVRLLAPSVSGE